MNIQIVVTVNKGENAWPDKGDDEILERVTVVVPENWVGSVEGGFENWSGIDFQKLAGTVMQKAMVRYIETAGLAPLTHTGQRPDLGGLEELLEKAIGDGRFA